MTRNAGWVVWGVLLSLASATAARSQQVADATVDATVNSAAQLPRLVKFSGTLKDGNGNPLMGVVGVTFALYSEESGQTPLWLETQDVQAGENGHYSVMLGTTKAEGMPVVLFASEQAQWLGVQPQGQAEQPRVMLVSVPYALKAVDAETLGGKPASAYALARQQTATSASADESAKADAATAASNAPQSSSQAAISGAGNANFIPLWTSKSALGASNIFQNATNKNVGIGTTSPTATLQVSGTTILSGKSSTEFAAAVNSPSQFGEVVTGPVSGVGAGIDLESTGRGGKQWEILATGESAIQGLGKFNIRDVTTSTDALTIDTSDNVNVKNLAASDTVSTLTLNADLASLGSAGMVSLGPVGVGPRFKTQLPIWASLDVQGNARDTLIGDPGCGSSFAGVGFQNTALTGCSNYSMAGDGSDTYLAAPTGDIYFRTQSNTVTPMIVTASGSVGMGTIAPNAKLDVRGQAGNSGFGIAADNNAWQDRGAGGWVKAMAYVDPFAPGGIAITRCYNSQATGAATSTPPCGIVLYNHTEGLNAINFGFQVNDRFVTTTVDISTAAYLRYPSNALGSGVGSFITEDVGTSNSLTVATYFASDSNAGDGQGHVDVPFHIFVF